MTNESVSKTSILDLPSVEAVTPPLQNVTPINQPKKMSKVEMKRVQQVQERFKRIKNKHPDLTDGQVIQKMQQEDVERLPLDKKFEMLQRYVVKMVQGIGQDIAGLQHNDQVLADAMDVNFRAISKALTAAGVPLEKQGEILKQVQEQISAEQTSREQSRAEEKKKANEEAQKAKAALPVESVEKSLDLAESEAGMKEESKGAEPPKDATVFGS